MAASAQQAAPRSAWLLLAFLTLINVVNFVDRQLITSLQIPLRDDPDLHLTDVQNQLLAGYAFSAVYSLAGLALGTLADRRHRPRLIALGLLVWSAMTAASGLAYNFWQLGLARIFVAVGEATLTPAAIAMLCDVFPPKRRALATGLYYLGIPLGASLSLIIANLLWPIPWVGWRGCFFVLGLIGLMLVAVLLFVRDPQRGGTEAPTDVPSHPATGPGPRYRLVEMFQALAGSPALVLTMLGGIVINIGVGTTWLEASWLNAERGFTKQGAPIFLGVALLLGGSAGNFIGGWLGDRMQHRWRGGRLLALIVLQCALTPFAVAFRFLPGDLRVPLFVCCVFTSMLITFMYGPVLATVQELTPLRLRATMIAFLLIGLNILGASLGSVLAAMLKDQLGSYTWGIFITAQASLLAIPLFWAARRFQLSKLSTLAAN